MPDQIEKSGEKGVCVIRFRKLPREYREELQTLRTQQPEDGYISQPGWSNLIFTGLVGSAAALGLIAYWHFRIHQIILEERLNKMDAEMHARETDDANLKMNYSLLKNRIEEIRRLYLKDVYGGAQQQ